MKLADLTPSQKRIMLSDAACVSISAEQIQAVSIQSKYGYDVSAMIADAAARENAVLIINLAADDPKALINKAICEVAGDKIAAAAKAIAEAIHASEIIIAAPDGISLPIADANVITTANSLVLREESALYHILATGELRSCPMDKEFVSQGYKGRPTVAADGETLLKAYAMTQDGYEATKLVVVRTTSDEVLMEVKEGTAVSDVISESGFTSEKSVLIGGVTGKFVADAANESICGCACCDSVAVYSKSDCMADITAKLMAEAHEQSCAKCVLCREGTWHLSTIYNDITAAKGKKEDLAMVQDIGPLIEIGAFCSFGKKMAAAAVSSAEVNRAELEAHIVKKQCPAGVCAAFNVKTYVIDPTLCVGCGDCEDECDNGAIEGKKKFIYMIDPDLCEGCGKCVKACEEGAIVINDGSIKVPKKLTKVGKFK